MAQSIHFWSDTKYAPLLAIPPTFMEMDTSSKNAGTFRDLRTAPKVVCDVNSEYRRIQVKSVEITVAFTTLFHYTNSPFYHTPYKLDILTYFKCNRDYNYSNFININDIPRILSLTLKTKQFVSSTFFKKMYKILYQNIKNQHYYGKPPRTVLTFQSVFSFSFILTKIDIFLYGIF